jgi:hypothetical protein
MLLKGYLEFLDLGIDPASGKKNILVQSFGEYQALTPEERERAWATIGVASSIYEVSTSVFYKKLYEGTIPAKTIKKNELDRIGLNLIKIPSSPRPKEVRREADIQRVTRVFKRTLRLTKWLSSKHRLLLEIMVSTNLRHIERELFSGAKNGNKGITEEGKHGQQQPIS